MEILRGGFQERKEKSSMLKRSDLCLCRNSFTWEYDREALILHGFTKGRNSFTCKYRGEKKSSIL